MGLATKIADYKATKTTLFWTAMGSSALTLMIGFGGMGWTTAKTAEEDTKAAIHDLRVEVAAKACLNSFLAADDAHTLQEELAGLTSYKAEKRISEDLGWIPGDVATTTGQRRLAARQCWNELRAAELPEPLPEPEIDLTEEVVAPAIIEIEPEIVEPTVSVVPGKAKPASKVDVKPEITLPEVVVEPAKAE